MMKRILIQSLFVVHAACFCLAPSSNLPFCRTPLRYRSTSGSVCVGMNLEKAQEAASVYTRNSPETNVLTIAEAALSARLLAAGALLSLIPAVAWGFVDVQDLSATPLAKKSATIIVEGFPRVVDGDTLVIEDEKGGKERIRLLGIDAPESKQTCKHKDGTEYMCGIESQQALQKLVGKDKVKCLAAKRDMYQRVLGVCFDERTNVDLNQEMVKQGEAIAYTAYSKAYVPEEATAKQQHVGVWDGKFQEPWEYRKMRRVEQRQAREARDFVKEAKARAKEVKAAQVLADTSDEDFDVE